MTDADHADSAPPAEVLKDGDQPPPEKTVVLARRVFPEVLTILPLNQRPAFPRMSIPMVVESEPIQQLLTETSKSQQRYVGMVLRRHPPQEGDASPPSPSDLYQVGVVAEILQIGRPAPEAPLHVLFGVHERFRIRSIVQESPHLRARVEYLLETDMADNPELKAYSVALINSIKELIQLNPLHKEELSLFMRQTSLHEPGRLADFAAALTTAEPAALQDVLETVSIRARLHKALFLIKKEIDVSKIQARITRQIEEKLTRQQREFFLREQLKAIKKELGIEKEGKQEEIERFEERLQKLHLTEEARERVTEEIEKLRLLEPASPEFTVSRNYLDWLTLLPWGVFTPDRFDLKKARRILDADHYGLNDVKERILEFLAVGVMKGQISGTILCFVGPPGVGKTSLGQSIARSIGRTFYRFSVGGIRDEAEIKGHRRTYIGAMPGKFIQTLKVCRSANPVIMIDEIDKIGASYHGDPASALLEVLDPEQNRDFLDHYLDVRFDLSHVFFICTANVTDTIPRPLLDRMEVIPIAGYLLDEKIQIARHHLIPRQLKAHGLDSSRFRVEPAALRDIVDGYAREPGVRGLENQIKKMIRKAVRRMVESPRPRPARITRPDVPRWLGKRLYTDEPLARRLPPGVAMGLAWTSLGGEALTVEATDVASDRPGFKQTGQLGNVMVESSEIAYTYVRSLLKDHAEAREFFQKRFIHLHVPAGATPKDGPSAGITMAVALYSLALRKPVKAGLAMTGELTLTGRIMPVGGIKEKTLAARRSKIRQVIYPAENRKDFDELPPRLRRGIKAHFARTFQEAIAVCF